MVIVIKRIERLYSLKEYENVKVIVEAQVDIWDKDMNEELEKIWTQLRDDIKKEKEKIKPTKVEN